MKVSSPIRGQLTRVNDATSTSIIINYLDGDARSYTQFLPKQPLGSSRGTTCQSVFITQASRHLPHNLKAKSESVWCECVSERVEARGDWQWVGWAGVVHSRLP